jgi:hypothetical protein
MWGRRRALWLTLVRLLLCVPMRNETERKHFGLAVRQFRQERGLTQTAADQHWHRRLARTSRADHRERLGHVALNQFLPHLQTARADTALFCHQGTKG